MAINKNLPQYDKNNRLIQNLKSNKSSPKISGKADLNPCNDRALITELDTEFPHSYKAHIEEMLIDISITNMHDQSIPMSSSSALQRSLKQNR